MTQTSTFGLLLAGALLSAGIAAVPLAAADGCIAYVYVPTQGWTCVPPDDSGPCLGYVYDRVTDEWRCIPDPRGAVPPPPPVPPVLPLPDPTPGGCIAYVNVPTQGPTCVPPGFDGPCIGYVHDPITDDWRCIPHP